MNEKEYFPGLDRQINTVLEKHPEIIDWRQEFPWLTGCLGNPFSGIWFLAENPSLLRVERVSRRSHEVVTIESQWSESPGDKLFRQMLARYGFKQGGEFSPGGWNCYITNVVKEPDYVARWQAKSITNQKIVAEVWSEVLIWELLHSLPHMIVVMGKKARFLLNHIVMKQRIQIPITYDIVHYSYIGSRPELSTHLPPMDPKRIEEYNQQFAEIFKKYNSR